MSGTVVVFDIGKTNAKLAVSDASNGNELWSRSCFNAPRQDGPYPHSDVEVLEVFLLDGRADAIRTSSGVLDGVVVTTHCASGALLERVVRPSGRHSTNVSTNKYYACSVRSSSAQSYLASNLCAFTLYFRVSRPSIAALGKESERGPLSL